jgi:phosphohistidine phosphatase SixA
LIVAKVELPTVLLVRHAKAGQRRTWKGDDRLRPLSPAGRKQADGLIKQLANYKITRVISSPYKRCTETVEALANRLDLSIEDNDVLAEGGYGGAVLDFIGGLDANHAVVLCTHGDVLPDVLEAATQRYGIRLEDEPKWPKGSTWVLEPAGDKFVSARYLPPSA